MSDRKLITLLLLMCLPGLAMTGLLIYMAVTNKAGLEWVAANLVAVIFVIACAFSGFEDDKH